VDKGILTVTDVWDKNSGPNWDIMKQKGWRDQEYLVWRSIIDAMPSDWRKQLRETSQTTKPQLVKSKCIELSNKLIPVSKVKTKMIYWELVKHKSKVPTSQSSISEKLNNPDIEWSSVYSRIYKNTIDTKLRAFQYKMLNNCLFLNKDLHKFKIVESPNCTFCLSYIETAKHFFIECVHSNNFYINIKNWLKEANIILPELNLEIVILGYDGNVMKSFLILLYKYVLFNSRSKGILPNVKHYQVKLLEYENIEYIIAEKNSKLSTHLHKYEKLRDILIKLNGNL